MASENEDTIHLDEVLSKSNSFGKYQLQITCLLGFAFMNNGMHCINFIFVAEEVPYRCEIEQCETGNQAYDVLWYNFTTPHDYRSCFKFAPMNNTGCEPINFNTTLIEPCTSWIYGIENSFVSEFQLACRNWERTFVGTVHSIGTMIGLLFQGQLSDKIGRKAAIIIAGTSAAVFGLAKSFAGSYVTYILLELLEATFGDSCSPAYIMSVELVTSKYRLKQQIFLTFICALGGVSLALVASYVTYWRNLIRAIYTPSVLFIFYYFILDESVRWLLSKGKKKQAIKLLNKIVKRNNIEIEDRMLNNVQCEDTGMKSSPLKETFGSKVVVRRFGVCLVWWSSCTFICFGLMINMVSLAGNKYVNFAIMSLSDIPASIAMVYTLKRFKRKKPLLFSFLLTGVLCFVQPFVPKRYVWLSTGLYFMGRFITTFTFSTVYMYTSELFPTYSRNSMHALCSSIGRIGSILAPMTPLLTVYMESLPTLLIGSISIFAGLTTILVPDLADEALPDNVRQAEKIGTCHVGSNKIV